MLGPVSAAIHPQLPRWPGESSQSLAYVPTSTSQPQTRQLLRQLLRLCSPRLPSLLLRRHFFRHLDIRSFIIDTCGNSPPNTTHDAAAQHHIAYETPKKRSQEGRGRRLLLWWFLLTWPSDRTDGWVRLQGGVLWRHIHKYISTRLSAIRTTYKKTSKLRRRPRTKIPRGEACFVLSWPHQPFLRPSQHWSFTTAPSPQSTSIYIPVLPAGLGPTYGRISVYLLTSKRVTLALFQQQPPFHTLHVRSSILGSAQPKSSRKKRTGTPAAAWIDCAGSDRQ